MDFFNVIKYQIINDIRRYFGKFKANSKIDLIIKIISFLLIYLSFVTLLSAGLAIDNITCVFNYIVMFVICITSLSEEMILYFKNQKYFGRMLLYSANITNLCIFQIIKYIAVKLLFLLAIFIIIVLAAITAGQSVILILKSLISFFICFIFSILLYFIISLFRILRSNKLNTLSINKFIALVIFNIALGYIIPSNIERFKSIDFSNASEIKEFFLIALQYLPQSIAYKESNQFFNIVLIYISILVVSLFIIKKCIKIIIEDYILKDEQRVTTKEFEKILTLSNKVNIILKKDIYKFFRNTERVKEYFVENIMTYFFINTFLISYYIYVGVPKDTKLIYVTAISIVFALFTRNHLTTFQFTSLEVDGKFIIYYICSNYSIKEIINNKVIIELIINALLAVCTIIIPVILYLSNVIEILFLLTSIIMFMISLSISTVYGTSCYPKFNWSNEDEIQNNLFSSVANIIFSYIPIFTVMIIIVLRLIWDKLGLQYLGNYEIQIFSVIVIVFSIINIFISKKIFKLIGRPYGEYTL